MKLKHAVPGLVWTAIGGAAWAYSETSGTPLVVRGTNLPWGAALVVVGVIIGVVGMIRNRKTL